MTLGLSTLAAAAAFATVAGNDHSIVMELFGAIAAAIAYWLVDVALLGVTTDSANGGSLQRQVSELWGFADFEIVVFAILGVFLGRLYEAHGVLSSPCSSRDPRRPAGVRPYLAVREQHEATLSVSCRRSIEGPVHRRPRGSGRSLRDVYRC